MPGGMAMANILDYLDWRGDLQISERSFNEVDNLLLAELCYLCLLYTSDAADE